MTPIRFDGQAAIVTGAGRGIGRCVALELAARGARVLVNDYGGDYRGQAGAAGPAAAVVEEIAAAGGVALANEIAVGSQAAAETMVAAALDAFGRIDILVNNAGVTLPGDFADTATEDVERVLQINLWGAYHLMRAAWPEMRRQGYGRIVNFTSNAVLGGYGGVAPYAVSKGGVLALTTEAATDGEPHGILVNAVTPMAYTRLAGSEITGPSDAFSGWLKAHFPPAMIAPAVAYLASRANHVSGEVFCVAGGRVSRLLFANNDGYFNENLTAEQVAENIDLIREPRGVALLSSGQDEMRRYRACHPFPDDDRRTET